MHKVVRDIGIYVVLLAAVIGAIWFYNNYKEDVLGYSLDLLGDKLLAMVPNEQHKAAIEKMYAKYAEQVREQKVSPEQVETTAAKILNLCHNKAKLTLDHIQAILYAGEIPKIELNTDEVQIDAIASSAIDLPDTIAITEFEIPEIPEMPPFKLVPLAKPVAPGRLVAMGERLKSMCDFNDKLQAMIDTSPENAKDFVGQAIFRHEKPT